MGAMCVLRWEQCEEIPFVLGPLAEGMRVALSTGLTVYELHIY